MGTFATAYLLYPFLENVVLLACVNWSWHAFNNPNDPEDEYVGSVTILDGPINVLNEDFHVVHHQYPGEHWTKHELRGQALGTVHRAPRDVLSRDARLRDLRHGGGARLRHASEEVRRPQRREDWKADDAPGDGEAAPVSRPRVLVGPPRAEG